jgi:UDP-3-O-[3-hydroxymyristoyl] glucosamine N-acyltransferase
MQFSAEQIAALIQGKIEGDPQTIVSGFGKIEEAGKSDLAFLANPKYEDYLYTTAAGIIIIGEQMELKENISATLIRVKDAYSSFAVLMQYYQQMKAKQLVGIEDPVFIHPSAKIGKDVYIAAFSYIGEHAEIGNDVKIFAQVFIGANTKVGDRTVLHPGVKLYHDCVIGNDVTIHAGTVLGSDGFGFAPQQNGTYNKVPQLGNVVIEDHVEIGANTCIDRATLGSTIIKKGTKLDNLLQIAHNVEVGEHGVIAAQTGISGSTKIGNHVMIGGQVGIVGHISIADGTKINGLTGISKSITEPNTSLSGRPAMELGDSLRAMAIYKRLPELDKKIKELEVLVAQLSKERDAISS